MREAIVLAMALPLSAGCSGDSPPRDATTGGDGGFGGGEPQVTSARAAAIASSGMYYPPCRACYPEPDGRQPCGPFGGFGDCTAGDCGGCGVGQECVAGYCDPPPLCAVQGLLADEACDRCAQASCCQELVGCSEDPLFCSDGNGGVREGFPLGAAVTECTREACGVACFGTICESELTTGDPERDACLEQSCCAELEACTDGGADVAACGACLETNDDPTCAQARECVEASGC